MLHWIKPIYDLSSWLDEGMLKMAEKISWKTIEKYWAGIYHRKLGKLENVRNFLLENVLLKKVLLENVLRKMQSWKMSEIECWKMFLIVTESLFFTCRKARSQSPSNHSVGPGSPLPHRGELPVSDRCSSRSFSSAAQESPPLVVITQRIRLFMLIFSLLLIDK